MDALENQLKIKEETIELFLMFLECLNVFQKANELFGSEEK